MADDFDFPRLLERVRQGDGEAIQVLYERYNDVVQRVVRRRLHRRLRRGFDSTDFSQSVWKSFVQLPSSRLHFDTPGDLVTYLSRLASNKIINVIRKRLLSQKQDFRRDMSLEECRTTDELAGLVDALKSRMPTPSQVVMAEERWQLLLARLPEGHRRVLELLRDGYPKHEISERLNIHPKVMQRLLAQLREFNEGL